MNKIVRKIFIGIGILLLLVLIAIGIVWIYRDNVLKMVIDEAKAKFETKYNCQFEIKNAQLIDKSSVELNEIYLIPKNADTLFSVKKVKTQINLWELITGDIQIQNLEVQDGFIQLVKNENGKNFDAFLKSDKKSNDDSSSNYAKKYNRILQKLLNLIPAEMKMSNFEFRFQDFEHKVTFQIPNLDLNNHNLTTSVQVTEDETIQNWSIAGLANPREKKTDLVIKSQDTSAIQIPYIYKKIGVKSGFDAIRFQLNKLDIESGELHIDGLASIENFTINHPKIAKKDVLIQKADFDYRFLIGKHFISIDTTSTAVLNNLKIKPYVAYDTEEDTIYKLKVKVPNTSAQTFIDALPKGLFTHFEGMQAEGNFDYLLKFEFNKNKPYRLVFDSHLNKNNLKITKYGQADLEKLNSDFVYRAIENGVPQRPVPLGINNPYYTPLDQIPSYLKDAVLTSEDPSFMRHKGFITEAFKQSIVKNIRTKKFARGASTISMQLIKNVFLTREKTLSRKLEEILLVYILENNRIASKERMLEVYFNIIEWGPDVYGIGEAAAFYFSKNPIDLSLNECLYLASIVPKPKKFMWQFDELGNQKSYAEKHQKFIKNLMLRRALITSEDTIGQSIPIKISGRARNFMRLKIPKDSIVQDSIQTESGEDFKF